MVGCLRRAVVLGLVLLMIGGLYLFRGRITDEWRGLRGLRADAQVASPELAQLATGKIEALRDGDVERVALGATELQSLIQYQHMGALPAFATSPQISLNEDHVTVRVRVPVDKMPNVKGLRDVANFLPDTAEVEVSGTLIPFGTDRVALGVNDVKASGIPLPARMIKDALKRVGRRDEPGLPADAIEVSLPSGVRAAYIRNDSLIFLARPRD